MAPLRILLSDDNRLFARGLEAMLSWSDRFKVVGQARNGVEAIALARETQPDLVLMDVDMPVCNGLEAVRVLKREMPQVKVVMLTVSDSNRDLFESIKAGAEGYLLKDMDPDQLMHLLEGVARGEAALSGLIAARILQEFAQWLPVEPQTEGLASSEPEREAPTPAAAKDADTLSQREIEVLRMLSAGRSNQEIADTLVITLSTVKTHLSNILARLHLRNRVQLAVYAVRHELAEDNREE